MATKATVASALATLLFTAMAVVQLLIAAGVLPIDIIWGSSQHKINLPLRCASIMAAALLLAMAYVIDRRARDPSPPGTVRILSLFITSYLVLNTIGNLLSPNWVEQYIFSSLTATLTLLCFIVISSPVEDAYTPI